MLKVKCSCDDNIFKDGHSSLEAITFSGAFQSNLPSKFGEHSNCDMDLHCFLKVIPSDDITNASFLYPLKTSENLAVF